MYQAAKYFLSISILTVSFAFLFVSNSVAQSSDLNQTLAESLNRQAIVKISEKQYPEAISLLKRAVEKAPAFAAAHMNLGSAYMLFDQTETGLVHMTRGVELEPTSHAGFNQLGVAYEKIGKTDKAIDALKKAVQLKPDYALGQFNLGAAYLWADKTKSAIEALEIAARLNPSDDKTKVFLGAAYAKQGKYKNAISLVRSVAERAPSNEEAQLVLCKIYLLADDRQAALNIYQTFKAVNQPLADQMFKTIFSDKVLFVPSDLRR